jgi:hypothetical protein
MGQCNVILCRQSLRIIFETEQSLISASSRVIKVIKADRYAKAG